MFKNKFRNKSVLVTGHTGFKGSWLSHWLLDLGAKVTGFALAPDTEPNLFSQLDLAGRINHNVGDIRDARAFKRVVMETNPEIVFHLAAQPLVRRSYVQPVQTWETNVLGTMNLLEALRTTTSTRVCIIVTTDKCYANKEWEWGYRESDALGGHDPYSASKAACEILTASYRSSFFYSGSSPLLSTARAGNVIGGGDQSEDRLVVDFIKSIIARRPLELRNPQAIRPWQHVLEPLSGYLWLAASQLKSDGRGLAEAWNFGPDENSCITVRQLAQLLVDAWGEGNVEVSSSSKQLHEANFLRLECGKSRQKLGWKGVWNVEKAVVELVRWQKESFITKNMGLFTSRQIIDYQQSACDQKIPWASNEEQQ